LQVEQGLAFFGGVEFSVFRQIAVLPRFGDGANDGGKLLRALPS